MRRGWFKDEDGTFYRNCPQIMRERKYVIRHLQVWKMKKLHQEWLECFQAGLIRKSNLGPGDEEIVARPFRETYPNDPILWRLDEK